MSELGRDVLRAIVLAAILICAALVIVGCASVPKPVAVQVKTVETVKLVPVPCVDPADIPAKTPTVMPDPKADAARKAAGAYVDMRNLYLENEQLRALLMQCTTTGVEP